MPDYRRWYVPGGMYFFTLVTHERRPFLCDDVARKLLRESIEKVREDLPFRLFEIVLLPGHLHAVMSLPDGDDRYPLRWKRIKELFTRDYLAAGGDEGFLSKSRVAKGERAVWQRRYWEHTIDSEDDLKRCVDYLHWNPKKHRLVTRVRDWPWSSFHRFVELGEYDPDWGSADPTTEWPSADWGE
ncbi:MAG: putative transposase [Planctomycetaceae bacterium]|jgi:putative transposase